MKLTKSNKQLALHIFLSKICNKFFTLHSQIIDYWLLFFLVTTCLNIAVHIVIDHFHRKEKRVVEKAVETWKNHVSTKYILEHCNNFIVDYIVKFLKHTPLITLDFSIRAMIQKIRRREEKENED